MASSSAYTRQEPGGKIPNTLKQSKHRTEAPPVPAYLLGLQRSVGNHSVSQLLQRKTSRPSTGREPSDENRTGMPDSLKAGLESLSEISLSGVRVHPNSPKPAEIEALAYTQGQDIYVGTGQEKHIAHEGWHVVQQLQGRVSPTGHEDGASINRDRGLEQEADQMGTKAREFSATSWPSVQGRTAVKQFPEVAQREAAVRQKLAPAFLGVSAAAWGVAANIASVVSVATGVASGAYSAAAKGESQVGSLVLPSNQMSSGDEGKLRQVAHFRIINAYVDRYLSVHPEIRDQLNPTYGPPSPAVPLAHEPPSNAVAGGTLTSPDRPTGAPTASAIDEAVMQAVKNSIETDLKTEMETATAAKNSTIEFRWGEDDTRGSGIGAGSSGSAESVGVTGFLRYRDLEGSLLRETLRLGSDARKAIGSVPGEGHQLLIHRFIGGSVGGTISRSYLQDLAVNVEGGAAQLGVADNGSAKLIVRTEWYWDRLGADVVTYMRNELHVTDTGLVQVSVTREGSPNDEPWA